MTLDLSTLRLAVKNLKEGEALLKEHPDSPAYRDMQTKRFDLAYEQAHKFIKRWLAENHPSPEEASQLSFPTMIREAYAFGIIAHSWDVWQQFRILRNKSVHTYNAEIAKEVLEGIPDFLKEAEVLLARLEAKMA
ncbi:nucleotidyltransferase [Acetobacteraceae bacterium]|nr:nucleotidyltransferase [Acetobacteraceae bacterium]